MEKSASKKQKKHHPARFRTDKNCKYEKRIITLRNRERGDSESYIKQINTNLSWDIINWTLWIIKF